MSEATWAIPEPEEQIAFLLKLQRLLSEGSFVSSYKFALLLALADLAVERGDDTTEVLHLDTEDLAERFIKTYWRQVLPWVGAKGDKAPTPLHQATGGEAAILRRIAEARARCESLSALERDRVGRRQLRLAVARTIAVMPLWKLQTVGRQRLEFLYANVGRGNRIALRGDAVYCFRRFRDLVGDMVQTAWIRFVTDLRLNRPLLGEYRDVGRYLFGADRESLARAREALLEVQGGRCFYCDRRVQEPAVDHFVPWGRYPLDLAHNYVLSDARCNGDKSDRLPAYEHLRRWHERNADPALTAVFESHSLTCDLPTTIKVAGYLYDQAERVRATVWQQGRGMVTLDAAWRGLLMPGEANGA